MEINEKKFKIICFPLPASGHSNPFYPILSELKKSNQDLHIIVYTTNKYKTNFENLGVECKLVDVDESELSLDGVRSEIAGLKISQELTKYACDNLESLAKEIEKEDPDLIIYDGTTIYVRWCILFYQKCYNASTQNKSYKKSSFRPKKDLPPLICYSPMYVMDFKSYPNLYEMSLLFQFSKIFSFRVIWWILKYVKEHYRLSLKYGFKLTNPFKKVTPERTPYTKFTIVTILEEIQPRSHLLEKDYFKFVGASIDDSVNVSNYAAFRDNSLNELIESFEVKENKINILDENTVHLIYVSLGTVFNAQFELFKTIIKAFRTFDLESLTTKSKIKRENLRIIVSTGATVYDQFQTAIKSNQYVLPDNIYLAKSAPQTEILKRASLFITHNGMNSTSESIHYGGK